MIEACRSTPTRALLLAVMVWGSAACSGGGAPSAQGGTSGGAVESSTVAASDPSTQLAAVEARAAVSGVPDLFGYGSAVDSARLAAWDIDVMPDGRGLPAGSGTALEGAAVYAARCAPCHGAAGEGGPNDRLVAQPGQEGGRTIGAWWPYSTTVFDYVKRAMPWDRPGTLSDAEVYAVVAWLLNRNGLVADSTVIDAQSLPLVQMPARGRFIPDDREAFTTVR